jgi:hypothetical protein
MSIHAHSEERYTRLRFGEADDVVQALSAVNAELRWALQNALERISKLEKQARTVPKRGTADSGDCVK